ncbi:5-oxoprolinase subunit PxpA [Pleomorphovibrio marinus]|uniref:5-oxoprolinase subunit PxpA n=1 Tax=Pleomorphovibrio marinus TaxID=2164132 RepID=UPI000E0CB7C3|nr:5-oxoprolinase subunit PxpA [Pleomorphovibrio marinus]
MEVNVSLQAKQIDLNSDLGEGFDDHAIMPYISSCNVACGGHHGDKNTIEATLNLAMEHQVQVGAHPSFPDKSNFGRKVLDMDLKVLETSLQEQLGLFQEVMGQFRQPFHHIKWHGALYNQAAKNLEMAQMLSGLVIKHYPSTLLYVPYGSKMAMACEQLGVPVWYEVFADRVYTSDLSLMPRTHPESILQDFCDIKGQVSQILNGGAVMTWGGKIKKIKAQTICVHGDHPRAVATTQQLFYFLKELGFTIK